MSYENKQRGSILTALGVLLLIVFILSLIPILYASFFAHPLADDYGYSAMVHHAVENGGGIFDVLSAAINKIKDSYFTWQGTFSAILIFSLQPGAFSDSLYFLTTFIMVASLTLSTYFLFETLLVKWLKRNKWYAIIIAVSTLFVSFQFIPDKKEGLYWFNGSSYYTLFYSLALVFFACLIRLCLAKKLGRKIRFTIICSVLAVLIGGSNYTTALVTVEIMFLSIILVFGKGEKDRSKKACYWGIFALLVLSFAISALAPGNDVRASYFEPNSPFISVIKSFYYSLRLIGGWTQLQQLALFAFLSPLLYKAAATCTFRFRYPLIAVALFYCLYSSQVTPPLYAMDSLGAGRQIDIYYYAYYLLVIFSLFYIYGWIAQRHPDVVNVQKMTTFCKQHMVACCFCLMVLFVAGCLNYGLRSMTSIDTAQSILNGDVQQYDAEYTAIRAQILENKKDCAISDIQTVPDFFGNLDVQPDPSYWANGAIAAYFGCESVYLNQQ